MVHPEKLRQIDEECRRVDALQQPTFDNVLEIINLHYPEDVRQFFAGSFDE
jgi:hypothetical protein